MLKHNDVLQLPYYFLYNAKRFAIVFLFTFACNARSCTVAFLFHFLHLVNIFGRNAFSSVSVVAALGGCDQYQNYFIGETGKCDVWTCDVFQGVIVMAELCERLGHWSSTIKAIASLLP